MMRAETKPMVEALAPEVAVLGFTISPTLTLEASPTTVSPSTPFKLSGTLSIRNDVDGSGRVDMADMWLLQKAYGSRPGDARWNPKADVDGSGRVDMNDMFLVVRAYGQMTGNKSIEIQQWDGAKWVTVATIKTSSTTPVGYYEHALQASTVTGTLYFRAYFPGGIF